MNKTAAMALALCSVFLWLPPAAAQTSNLLEIYQAALENDPVLLEAQANRMARLEDKPQALAGLLPTFNFQGQRDDQETDGASTTFQVINGTGVLIPTDRVTDARRTQWSLNLNQPLFRWDRWIAFKRADKTIAQEEANYAAAEQELAVRVTQRYFDVLGARDNLEAVQANKAAIARQLEQAETRFEVGLIAITDVYESRAAYDQSVADEIVAKRTLATALETLREVTGSYPGDLAAPGEDLPLISPDPQDQEQWVQRALAQNLSLEASRIAAEIADDDIKTQRTGHYPTLDLVLSRSDFDSKGTQFDSRDDIVSGGTSDFNQRTDNIALQVNFPIYSGGAVASRVRQARHNKTAAQQRLERVARETERQTRDAYLSVIADISRVNALKQAVTSSETALKATEAGFDVGTRTSVDVLNSRVDLLRAQTNYKRARYDYLLNIVLLKQAAGTLSADDLREVNQWLKY